MKLSFAMPSKKASTSVGTAPSLKRPAAFSSMDDDGPVDAAPTAGGSKVAPDHKKLLARNLQTSKTTKKRMEAEKAVDQTVYEYDAVWDRMQEAKARQKEAKEVDSKDRKPKYIGGLLNSAATRKLDYLRAEEKMIAREREAEGDEFGDKEAFVTQAYKDQQAAVRKAEAEEKLRDELEKKKNGGPPTGLAYFYRQMLNESETAHEATVAATLPDKPKVVIGPQGPVANLTISKPADFTPKSDLDKAKAAKEEGRDVELNDDNQIVDKSELLAAGLNLSLPNTRQLGKSSASTSDVANEHVNAHRAAGTAASRKEINARRAREIQQQMGDEEARVQREKEQATLEAQQRVVLKRNNEDDVMSAKDRYLQRKRQKLEADAAAGPS